MERHGHDAGQSTDPDQRDDKEAMSEKLEAGCGTRDKRAGSPSRGVATVNRGIVAIKHVSFNAIGGDVVPSDRRVAAFSPLCRIGHGARRI
jgi:hypothetical protein